jgi:hypothetical protein
MHILKRFSLISRTVERRSFDVALQHTRIDVNW